MHGAARVHIRLAPRPPEGRRMASVRGRGNEIAAVRGAVQVAANRADDIREATARLLIALLEANRLTPERIVSAVFTATPDLDADFPARAARGARLKPVYVEGAEALRPDLVAAGKAAPGAEAPRSGGSGRARSTRR